MTEQYSSMDRSIDSNSLTIDKIRLYIKGFAIFALIMGIILPTVTGDFLILNGSTEAGSGTFVELYTNRGVVYPPVIEGNQITVSENGESFFGVFMFLFIIAFAGIGLGLFKNYQQLITPTKGRFARGLTLWGTIFYAFIVFIQWTNVNSVNGAGEELNGMYLIDRQGSTSFYASAEYGIAFYFILLGVIGLLSLPILNRTIKS